MLPKFTFSGFLTSHLAPTTSGTSQGWGDQLQALVQGSKLFYN